MSLACEVGCGYPVVRPFSKAPWFSNSQICFLEATFSSVGVAFADVISDAVKGKSRFARTNSPCEKRAYIL
jgi:hypothetical protein